jgi:hypothetical protein
MGRAGYLRLAGYVGETGILRASNSDTPVGKSRRSEIGSASILSGY